MTILIIEDEPALRDTLRILLEFHGHTVLAAADGREGIALASQAPDMVFSDVGLPDMEGYEVITAIRKLPKCSGIPFIFLTARADRDDQRRGMALGADDYITKPFNSKDIIEAINARNRRQHPLHERVEQLVAERRRAASAEWSHELMTPLNGMLGGLALIEAEADTIKPGELKGLLAMVRAAAERQFALSRKLVLYFELEGLKATGPVTSFSCVAGDSITTAAERAAQASHREKDLTVTCDPGNLHLLDSHLIGAVEEIVDNAFKFSLEGQSVTVTGTRRNARYEITVIDHGHGMTAGQMSDIAPFRQFDREQRNQQGLGLGLTIARSVAELAGGRLTLSAHRDGSPGLQATFDLPCTD
jgi:CheY-like chemotaxis protein